MAEPAARLAVDIVSDSVCPWCWIGKRRFEAALAARPHVAVDIRWRPYRLNPEIPPEGLDRDGLLARKFGSLDRARALFAGIARAGEAEGLRFDFDRIRRAPDTSDSHRLIRWAGSAGVADAVVEGVFSAFFAEGRDISDHEVLCEIAARAGMDSALVARLLAGDEDRDAVREEIAIARKMGINGVPAFILDGRFLVTGAQPPDVLGQALDRALAEAA